MAIDEQESVDSTEESPKLKLEVKIDSPSACERHMTVTISREDIDRYFDDAFSELMPSAAVPGFRAGRAPRKLVEHRFRKDVADQVKGSLLVDSMAQVSEDHELTPISEPDFDLDAIEVPEEGPMTYEFNLEVRPDFDLPKWEGLEIERPTRDVTDADIDARLEQVLGQFGQIVPHEGPADLGDFLVLRLEAEHDGRHLASTAEQQVRLRSVLSLQDCRIEDFDKLMKGAKAGDKKKVQVELSQDAANEDLRGKTVDLEIEVLDVKQSKLPELNAEFFAEHGGRYQDEGELRDAIRDDMNRQLEYQQQQQARRQVTSTLTAAADWELPPNMLRRQSRRELERAVLELRRAGYSEEEIRARENALRQNSSASTAKALKEHFILERIAEDQNIEAEDTDYDMEIALIAMQSGESVRRVRAQLEKRGLMDSLRNQIIERKTLGLILDKAKFKDVPLEEENNDVAAINFAAGGSELETSAAAEANEAE
ncbi:MAG: trigger factor [Planctomycetales bacterium]|nr:trigger factor [Planctomycetales bacterium]